jgi:DNA-binding transcriptional MerR regulator
MTVGELAKAMDTTVRTLQHYDKLGLLPPSAESSGGRRLYSDEDLIKLSQIQELKSLGFRLDEIKDRLPALDTPEQVAVVLAEQAENLQEQIDALTTSLSALKSLREEVLQMHVVDYDRYAAIIKHSRNQPGNVWVIKHLTDPVFDRLRSIENAKELADRIEAAQNLAIERAVNLQAAGVPPESQTAMELVGAPWWQAVLEFTGGDLTLLSELAAFRDSAAQETAWEVRFRGVEPYLNAAMSAHVANAASTGELDPESATQLAQMGELTHNSNAKADLELTVGGSHAT